MINQESHVSVLRDEVVRALAPKSGGVYVDGTFGAGGYSRALLQAADCTVWGIDRDPLAQGFGADLQVEFPGKITVLSGRYGDMADLLATVDADQIDGITLDLGISSMQIDNPSRGFSFRGDGPLDMRMGCEGQTAADVVNGMAESELADVIYRYGEERASRRVARAIVACRSEQAITRTGQLATVVRSAVAKSKDGIDPATRTFQALRIYVNDELGELDHGLAAAEKLLVPGGRLAIVSFHSLEDRRVKTFLQERSGAGPRPSRHAPHAGGVEKRPTFRLVSKGGIKPGSEEICRNPRARSARLRIAERTDAPVGQAA